MTSRKFPCCAPKRAYYYCAVAAICVLILTTMAAAKQDPGQVNLASAQANTSDTSDPAAYAPSKTPGMRPCILRVFVYGEDRRQITDASVRLLKDGHFVSAFKYNSWRAVYELVDAPDYPLEISVAHPAYEGQERMIGGGETMSTFYLGKPGSKYFVKDEWRIPIAPRRDQIAVMARHSQSDRRLIPLFDSLGLEEVAMFEGEADSYSIARAWKLTLLRKANGENFDQADCHELRKLRNSELVRSAGPLFGRHHFLSGDIIAGIDSSMRTQVERAAAALGLSVLQESRAGWMLFASDPGIGLDIRGIVRRLGEVPGVSYSHVQVGALYGARNPGWRGDLSVRLLDKQANLVDDALVTLRQDGDEATEFFYCFGEYVYVSAAALRYPLTISVSHPTYEAQHRTYEEKGPTNRQIFYLGSPGDRYFVREHYRGVSTMMPFEERKDLIAVIPKNVGISSWGRMSRPDFGLPTAMKRLFDSLELRVDSLFTERMRASLPRKDNVIWNAYILRKEDGSDYDAANSRALRELRRSELILGAGPPLGYHYWLTRSIRVCINRQDFQGNRQAIAALGLSLHSLPFQDCEYRLKASEGCGLALLDILSKLRKMPGVRYCYPETGSLYTIDDGFGLPAFR